MATAALTSRSGFRAGLLDRLPDIVRCQRDIQGSDSQGQERIDHGVGNGGGRGHRACLAGSFHPQHVERAWRLGQSQLERRQVFGNGNGVVHQRCAEHLPSHVIGHLLIEGLADALSNGPMRLTLYHRGPKDMAVIVDRNIALELDLAGFRVTCTTARCAPKGYDKSAGSKPCLLHSPLSSSFWRSSGNCSLCTGFSAILASWAKVYALPGTPETCTAPSRSSRSLSPTSSRCEANLSICALTACAASLSATPPTPILRLAKVASEWLLGVSPIYTSTCSRGTLNS